jgi:hypothetical protein
MLTSFVPTPDCRDSTKVWAVCELHSTLDLWETCGDVVCAVLEEVQVTMLCVCARARVCARACVRTHACVSLQSFVSARQEQG